jgi:hypothetical protein
MWMADDIRARRAEAEKERADDDNWSDLHCFLHILRRRMFNGGLP